MNDGHVEETLHGQPLTETIVILAGDEKDALKQVEKQLMSDFKVSSFAISAQKGLDESSLGLFVHVFELVKDVIKSRPKTTQNIVVAVLDDDSESVYAASLAALLKTASIEQPKIQFKSIHFAKTDIDEVVRRVVQEA